MTPATQTLVKPREPGRPGAPFGPGGDGSGGPGGGDGAAVPSISAAGVGVWLLVGAITILFAAFTSTYLVRRSAADWRVGPLPPALWINTAVLLASSAVIEWARSQGRRDRLDALRRGLGVTTVLGGAFLVGQIAAWRQLVDAGVYLATSPHGSFFYLLTGMHGLHVAGGVGALAYALWKVQRLSGAGEVLGIVNPTAVYWHFVDGLWLYVFGILFWL